jgi:hypothetical protein
MASRKSGTSRRATFATKTVGGGGAVAVFESAHAATAKLSAATAAATRHPHPVEEPGVN